MTVLPAERSTRLVWRWVLLYTAATPGPIRDRRREELCSHLWEARSAGVRPRRVVAAAARGIGSDISWALTAGIAALFRSLGTPTPYVVLAGVLPLQAWIVSSLADPRLAQAAEASAGLGGPTLLICAGAIWVVRRAHRS
jgi:hypothetical protein